MRAEAECPDCSGKLGLRIASSVATLMGDSIERLMDKKGNAVYCQDCEEYVEPDTYEIKD